jgi:hypothetical protein
LLCECILEIIKQVFQCKGGLGSFPGRVRDTIKYIYSKRRDWRINMKIVDLGGFKSKLIRIFFLNQVNLLFALYPVSLKQQIADRIAAGRLRMTDLILENKHTLVPSISREFPEIFRNVNNEEELKMTEEKWNDLK